MFPRASPTSLPASVASSGAISMAIGRLRLRQRPKGMHATPEQAADHHNGNAGDIEHPPKMTGPRLLGVNARDGNRNALHSQRASVDQYLTLEHKDIPGDIAMLDFVKERSRVDAKPGLGIGGGISGRPRNPEPRSGLCCPSQSSATTSCAPLANACSNPFHKLPADLVRISPSLNLGADRRWVNPIKSRALPGFLCIAIVLLLRQFGRLGLRWFGLLGLRWRGCSRRRRCCC